jgi:hypothetical protein
MKGSGCAGRAKGANEIRTSDLGCLENLLQCGKSVEQLYVHVEQINCGGYACRLSTQLMVFVLKWSRTKKGGSPVRRL